MLRSARGFRIWVCNSPADMRKSFDTLAALVETVLRQDPLSGHWFVFVNRRANRMKILCFEGDGAATCRRWTTFRSRSTSFTMSLLKRRSALVAARTRSCFRRSSATSSG